MLDLDAGVHLDEVEAAVLVEELEGAGAAVADADAGFDADLADLGALLRRDARRGCFFDHLLVAALHGAVAFAQMDGVALAVGEYLDFHVARVLQEFLHVDLVVAERGLGFALGGGDGVVQVRRGVHHAHAATAAAAGSLDDHRVTDFIRNAGVLGGVLTQRAARSRHTGHAGRLHGAYGFDLVAHQADGLGTRTDEHEATLLDALREVGVFRQEAVAGMDGLGVRDFGRGDQGWHVEVALDRRRTTDADRLIGHGDVLQVAIHRGMHGDRLDAQGVAGAQDAQRNLATVGDDDFIQHGAGLN